MLSIEFLFNPGTNIRENIWESVLDAGILSVIVFPTLYYFSFRPLVTALLEQQVTAKALKASSTFLEKVFASLNDAVLVVRVPEYKILSCNLMAERTLGINQEDLVGQSISDLFFKDQTAYEHFIQEIRESLHQRELHHTKISVQPHKQLRFTADVTVTEIREDDVTLQVFSLRDITEKEKAEHQLRLRTAALSAAANGIIITDTNGLIEWANPALSEMTGYPFGEIVGNNLDMFMAGPQKPETFASMWREIATDQSWEGEVESQRKDGSLYTETQTIAPVRDSKQEITHYVAVKQDITKRKEAEAQLAQQNLELQTMAKLGQTVVSSLELEVVFDQVVKQLQPLLKAESLSIILREEAHMVYVATGGLEADKLKGQRTAFDVGIPGLVMKQKKSIRINENEDLLDTICSCHPRSLVAAPLRLGDEVFGLIQATHRQSHTFTEDSLRMLQAGANWAAIAISHARQLQEIRWRLRETATLSAINQSLNETLDLDSALQLIADSAPRLIGNVDRVVIHLFDQKEQILYPAIWSGQLEEMPTLYLNPGEGVAGKVLRAGKLVNIPDVQQSEDFRPFPSANGLKSLMVGPLQSGQRPLGTISVHNQHRTHAFSTKDENLLMRLASSAAVAINTARLYQAERQQRQFAEDLAQAAAVLSRSLKVSEVLRNILDQAIQIIRCQGAAIFLLRENRVYLAQYSDEEQVNAGLPEPLKNITRQEDIRHAPPLKLLFDVGKPIVVANQDDYLGEPGELPWRPACAIAPLRVADEIIGFLLVNGDKPGAFNQEAIQRLEALAAHATLAVQNARLYNELEAALQKEQVTRAQLVQAQKLSAMGRLVASVAHELNNPLQTIKNCLFLVQQDVQVDEVTGSYLEMATSETKRLANLVRQLREVYRPAGSGEMHPTSITAVIEQVTLILKQHLAANNVTWQYNNGEEDHTIIADANHLKQVFLNICLNAIEAMQPDGGTLTIEHCLDKDQHRIGVCIKDSGPGIPPEDLSKLFEPFFTTKDTGTGLGLAICYDIVQNHGGHIVVENGVEQGAVFTVWLPLASEEIILE